MRRVVSARTNQTPDATTAIKTKRFVDMSQLPVTARSCGLLPRRRPQLGVTTVSSIEFSL
jgi:hypothetical protein